jgi:hypothetical protein
MTRFNPHLQDLGRELAITVGVYNAVVHYSVIGAAAQRLLSGAPRGGNFSALTRKVGLKGV